MYAFGEYRYGNQQHIMSYIWEAGIGWVHGQLATTCNNIPPAQPNVLVIGKYLAPLISRK